MGLFTLGEWSSLEHGSLSQIYFSSVGRMEGRSSCLAALIVPNTYGTSGGGMKINPLAKFSSTTELSRQQTPVHTIDNV